MRRFAGNVINRQFNLLYWNFKICVKITIKKPYKEQRS